jgi:hypothetical protein
MPHSRSTGPTFWRTNVRKDYDIVGSYNNQKIVTLDGERSVNVFEYRDQLIKKSKALLSTSGIVDSNVRFPSASGGFRAQFVFKGVLESVQHEYQVIGPNIYQINPNFNVPVLLNASLPLSLSQNYVGIDANTYQIMFVDGVSGYIWNTTNNTFLKITDTNFPNNSPNTGAPVDVCSLDGFFNVAAGGTNNFQLCEFNQGLVWGGSTTPFTATASPNQITIPAGVANFQTGVAVQFAIGMSGVLPMPLDADTTYYVIQLTSTTIQVAATLADALAIPPVPIVLTSDGTPPNNISNIGQLQIGSITSHPGTIVACRTLHRRLFLFSQNFTEVWENQGIGSNLPFRRNNSLLMEYGCAALGSVRVGFDRMYFLAQDKDGLGAVMQVSGSESIPVSTRALDVQLANYASTPMVGIADATGILLKENGFIFYRLNFTLANHTFVYNVTQSDPTTDATKFWHEEEVLNGDRHPAQTHVYFGGNNYYGDYLNPTLYLVDSALSTNNGEAIRRMRIGRPFVPETYQRLRVDRFHLDLLQGNVQNMSNITNLILLTQSGQDITTESGENLLIEEEVELVPGGAPVVFLQLSKDGGQTFGNQLLAPMGQIGQRSFRTVWRKLGTVPRGQPFVPKIQFFSEVPFIVMGAAWDFEVMPE